MTAEASRQHQTPDWHEEMEKSMTQEVLWGSSDQNVLYL